MKALIRRNLLQLTKVVTSSSKQDNNNIEDEAMSLIEKTCKHLFDEDPDLKTKTLNIMICLREPAHAPYERRELMWDPVRDIVKQENNVY